MWQVTARYKVKQPPNISNLYMFIIACKTDILNHLRLKHWYFLISNSLLLLEFIGRSKLNNNATTPKNKQAMKLIMLSQFHGLLSRFHSKGESIVASLHQYLLPPKDDAKLDDFMDSPLEQFLLVFLRFDLM